MPAMQEGVLARGARPDHLVVEHVRRHPDQLEVAAALAQELVPGRERDQVREALERDAVSVVDQLRYDVGERGDRGHLHTDYLLAHKLPMELVWPHADSGRHRRRGTGRADAQIGRASWRGRGENSGG